MPRDFIDQILSVFFILIMFSRANAWALELALTGNQIIDSTQGNGIPQNCKNHILSFLSHIKYVCHHRP